jgi:hypothetical protein
MYARQRLIHKTSNIEFIVCSLDELTGLAIGLP